LFSKTVEACELRASSPRSHQGRKSATPHPPPHFAPFLPQNHNFHANFYRFHRKLGKNDGASFRGQDRRCCRRRAQAALACRARPPLPCPAGEPLRCVVTPLRVSPAGHPRPALSLLRWSSPPAQGCRRLPRCVRPPVGERPALSTGHSPSPGLPLGACVERSLPCRAGVRGGRTRATPFADGGRRAAHLRGGRGEFRP
jgi:hypothetical protein